MKKKLLHSDEEYFAYCEQNQIGNIDVQCGSQSCVIENGTACHEEVVLYKGTDYEEYLNFDNKPLRYPCIFVYDDGLDSLIRGMFIYPENFEEPTKVS